MKLLSLSLRGAIGIEQGLGLEQVEIDFTKFDSGLIAFSATNKRNGSSNGSGKSTILDNLQPYRCLASKAGSLQQHFYLRDSHRDLSLEMDGHVYRCRILIDGGAARGKQEAYLYRDGEPLAGPNATEYDAKVRELFGSESMFFRSLFRAQNAQSITELRDGDRKALFTELLGLEHFQQYHEQAKTNAQEIEARIADARARITMLEQEAGEGNPDLVTFRQEAVASCRQRISGLEADLVTLRAQHAEALVSVAVYDQAAKEVAGLREREVAANGARDRIWSKLATAKAERTDVGIYAAGEQQKEKEAAASSVATTTAKRDRAAKIAANRGNVVTGLETLRAAEAEVAILGATQMTSIGHGMWRGRLEQIQRDIEGKGTYLQHAHDAKIEALEKTLAGVEAQAALTASVPCAGMELQDGCQLLTRAIEARDTVPSLQADIDALRAVNPLDVPDMLALREALKAHEAAEPGNADFDASALTAAQATAATESAKNWPGLLAEADAATDVIAECDARLAEIEAETARRIEAIEARYNADEARLAAEVAALEAELAAAAETCKDLAADLAAAETRVAGRETAEAGLAQIAVRLTNTEQNVRMARTDLEAAQRALAEAEARLAAATRAKEEADRLAASIAPDIAQLSEWSLLARACAKDGLQALELDAAGPGVAAIANQLLADTFGSQFQIAFETTRPKADGKGSIEVFDIRVSADGVDQTIENLSGGQRVWIEAAISQAIAIYLRRKSGLDLRTSYLDEADGALDSDNAFRYLSMLRASHALAGVHHTLLITHRQELLAHIPQQIRLVPGVGIEVEA